MSRWTPGRFASTSPGTLRSWPRGAPDVTGRDRDYEFLNGPDATGRVRDYEVLDDIIREEFSRAYKVLKSRTPEIDTETRLDEEEVDRLGRKHARYRVKACLLLKGKRIYPPKRILENAYLCRYIKDEALDWYFDSDLCSLASLSNYQRLVLCNEGGYEYASWSEYREFYNTPEADRDYLRYWDLIGWNLKWFEDDVLKGYFKGPGFRNRALCQAIRIAARFPNIYLGLAYHGIEEYIRSTHLVNDLACLFSEIWKLVNGRDQMCFGDALEHVYDENRYPLGKHKLNHELRYNDGLNLEELFRQCTQDISKDVPDWIDHEIISREVRLKCALPKTYVQYARKKLKIAETIGLIPKAKIRA